MIGYLSSRVTVPRRYHFYIICVWLTGCLWIMLQNFVCGYCYVIILLCWVLFLAIHLKYSVCGVTMQAENQGYWTVETFIFCGLYLQRWEMPIAMFSYTYLNNTRSTQVENGISLSNLERDIHNSERAIDYLYIEQEWQINIWIVNWSLYQSGLKEAIY